jgi:hypothetical protein
MNTTKTIMKLGIALFLVGGMVSCGTKHDAKKITQKYCDCMGDASGLSMESIKAKGNCMLEASKEYTEVIKGMSSEEVSAFKEGFDKGMNACK